MTEECGICTPGNGNLQLCRNCFMLWYDSGITEAPVLAREARWRKANSFWPWGAGFQNGETRPRMDELKAMEELPLPDLETQP